MFGTGLTVGEVENFKFMIFWGIFQIFKCGIKKGSQIKSGWQIPVPTVYYCLEGLVLQRNLFAILPRVFYIIKNLLAF